MTRIKMMFLATGVWVLAAGSAAALTVELGRPPTPRLTTPDGAASIHTDLPAPPRRLGIDPPVLTLPSITIVGRAERSRPSIALPANAPKPFPDIARMNCAPWHDLQMGSGRVQACE
jgi:hypothetical protein